MWFNEPKLGERYWVQQSKNNLDQRLENASYGGLASLKVKSYSILNLVISPNSQAHLFFTCLGIDYNMVLHSPHSWRKHTQHHNVHVAVKANVI